MAASVSTRVVSWNDAAEMKLSVEREALVIPSSSGSAMAGSPPRPMTLRVLLIEAPFLDMVADQKIGVADFLDPHPAQHLAHDHFDVLVVDAARPAAGRSPGFRRPGISPAPSRRGCVRMSCGLTEPSISGSPALTWSPSCTPICLPLAIRYSAARRLPASRRPCACPWCPCRRRPVPSISEMTANSLGLRASNNSATRGRPPVMSLVLVVSRGIFAMTSPGELPNASGDVDIRADRQEVARHVFADAAASASCRARP